MRIVVILLFSFGKDLLARHVHISIYGHIFIFYHFSNSLTEGRHLVDSL
jgi:hypothetical protein